MTPSTRVPRSPVRRLTGAAARWLARGQLGPPDIHARRGAGGPDALLDGSR